MRSAGAGKGGGIREKNVVESQNRPPLRKTCGLRREEGKAVKSGKGWRKLGRELNHSNHFKALTEKIREGAAKKVKGAIRETGEEKVNGKESLPRVTQGRGPTESQRITQRVAKKRG